ncbi:MAG TPA: APC family permease [Gemmatimonadales bacterium]
MTAPGGPATPELRRTLTLRDLVLLNVVAVLSIRWLATSAAAGPSSLVLWVCAALFFFIPQGLAVADLSARFPEEGGIYAWTKRAFGEGHGFLCGWCYWINNVLYYPSLLLSGAVIATYAFGLGDSGLGDRWTYALPVTLVAMWLAVLLNVLGLGVGKWLHNVGALGSYIPGVVIVGLGVAAVTMRPPANTFTAVTLIPDLSKFSELNLWASIAFAFAGLELSATLGGEIRDPRRTLPRSIYLAAPLIALIYIAGTGAILWLVPQKNVNLVSGLLQGIDAGARGLGPVVAWVVPLAAAANALGNLGCVGAWLTGCARVAFVVGLDRYVPEAFGRIHPRWGTPYVAILVQAALSTIFLLVSVVGKGTTVEKAYLVLLDTMILVYFIPYCYMFLAFLVFGAGKRGRSTAVDVPRRPARTLVVGATGFTVTVFAMVVATIPPPGTTAPWLFEAKVLGGASAFVAAGGLVYWRARRLAGRAPLLRAPAGQEA